MGALFATITGRSPYEYAYRVSNKQGAGHDGRQQASAKLNRPEVPPQVEQVLRKALDKNPRSAVLFRARFRPRHAAGVRAVRTCRRPR